MKNYPARTVLWGACISLVLGVTHHTVRAQEPSAQGPSPAPSVGEFVTPTGKFDLEKARRSGYQGPLDLKGFESTRDLLTGDLSIRPSATNQAAADPDDIYWDNSISPSLPGVSDPISALTVYDAKLIAGGSFTIAGGVAANYIAAWDGSSWLALGSGTDGQVSALTVYNGKLCAGGYFTTAGGTSANHIARWDGSSWSAWGSGMDGPVLALTVYGSELCAGGYFTAAGGTAAFYIAAWNGSSWSALGSGMN